MWDVDGLLERNCVLNLLVIGDSDYEIEAGKKFKRASYGQYTDQRILLKSIKFKEEPTPEQLIQQLVALDQKFD